MTRPVALLLLAPVLGCAPPDLSFAFHQVTPVLAEGPVAANAELARVIGTAEHTLRVALPEGEDTAISEAILDRWTSGVEVEVVTDVDRAADPAIAALLDGGVPVTLADGGLDYFDFNVNTDIAFASTQTVMSNAWAIVDDRRALLADRAGGTRSGQVILLEVQGEELIEDLRSEHNQLFGGTDATSTTAFDGLAKSIADVRWRYPTQADTDVELWFGPQERLVKRVIDAVYSARGSVELLSNDLTSAGLARALQDKAALGFPVRAVVGPAFGAQPNRLSDVFRDETPDVVKRRFTASDDVPTVVIVDRAPGLDGKEYDTRIFVLSHDLYTTSRLSGVAPVTGPTDQLIDGTLWVWIDYDAPSSSTRSLIALWEHHFDLAGSF